MIRFLTGLLLSTLVTAVVAADPVVTTVLPDTGDSAADGITNATTLTVNGTADVGATVTLLFDGTNPPTTAVGTSVVVDGSGTFSISLTTGVTTYATRYLRARAVLGMDQPVSAVRTLVIDPLANAPVITGITPQGQTGFTNDSTPTVSGTGDPGATVSVSAGGLLGTTTVNGSGAWTFPLTIALPDGSYSFTATQEDLAGNGPSVASASVALTVDTFHAGLAVLSHPSGLINNATPAFQGLCEIGATVEIRTGSANGAVIGSTVNAADPWTMQPASALADGDYIAYVVSTDAAGNTQTAGPYSFTLDTIPPQALVIAGFLTANGVVLPGGTTNDRTLSVIGLIAAVDAGTAVSISVDGVGVATAIADGSGAWQATLPSLRDATWTVTASASDAAGNSATSPAAAITINAPQDTLAQRFTPVRYP